MDAFEGFVQQRSRALLRTAWLLTGSWASAEDLVQTSLAKCLSRWPKIARMEHPEAYVRRVMLRTYLGWRRRKWSGEVVVEELPDEPSAGDPFGAADMHDALVSALRRLPAGQRAVVTLRYFDDLTEAATAEALGCSVGTVKSQASRALSALREQPALRSLVREESH